MISIKILEVKPFMAKLLANTVFDSFYLKEAEIQTFTSFHITGQFYEDFFNSDELMIRGENRVVLWSEVRNIVFAMIKGTKSPLGMKIVFQLPKDKAENLVMNSGGKLRQEDVGGLYLNVRYEKGELYLVTGVAIKTFTLDKTLEQEWDSWLKQFLKEEGITFEDI